MEGGLIHNCYDAAVHSLKDMPTTLPDGLTLATITEREDPRDCVVIRDTLNLSNENKQPEISLDDLPVGSIIGTSSVRREAILKRRYKDKKFRYEIIRGNVNTRLKKLDNGEYDATILAVAGLKRLGKIFEDRIWIYLKTRTIN